MLTVKDLVFYGLVLIQPIAPVGIFGLSSKMSHGHASATIVIAMVAMMLTAFSYGRMAAIYPSAGSAYTFVSRGLEAHLGFLAGWAMFLDYLIVPLINTIYGSLTLERLFPAVPYSVWAVLFVVIITLLNLRGIRAAARANVILLAVMTVVIVAFVVLALRYLVHGGGWEHVLSVKPFYDPETFDLKAVATATSLAASPTSALTASPPWPKKSTTPNATSSWRSCWSAFSRAFSAPSRSTWHNKSGRTIRPLPIWKRPSTTCASVSAAVGCFGAWRSRWPWPAWAAG